MRLLHTAAKTHARFDDPNLVSLAGLIPALRLAQDIGLEDLARQHVRVAAKVGANGVPRQRRLGPTRGHRARADPRPGCAGL